MNKDKYSHLFRQIYLIRRFEHLLHELFSKGEISGTTHTYIGQEAIAVGVINHLSKNDTPYSRKIALQLRFNKNQPNEWC